MQKSKIWTIVFNVLTLVLTVATFSFLNNEIPIHFGIDGKPDQYGSKYFILLFGGLACIISVVMLIVGKSKKLTDNYRKYLHKTSLMLSILFFVLTVIFAVFGITYNENVEITNISKIIIPILGALFIFLSNMMPKIEKNKTLGFKTYWSMYNEVTWQKTHRLAGLYGVVLGVLVIILSFFFDDVVNFIVFFSLLLTYVIAITVASYIYYKEEKKKEVNETNV